MPILIKRHQTGDILWDCGYVHTSRGNLFRAYGIPGKSQGPSIVICNPLAEEAKSSFAVTMELCRALWKEGWSVVRFDYRGTGDSEGDFADSGLEDWLADAFSIIRDFTKRVGGSQIILMGLRLGANIASEICSRRGKEENLKGIVLWEPVLDIRRYLRHLEWANRSKDSQDGIDHYGWCISPKTLCKMEKEFKSGIGMPNLPIFMAKIDGSAKSRSLHQKPLNCDSLHITQVNIQSRPFWEPIGQHSCMPLVAETTQWISNRFLR